MVPVPADRAESWPGQSFNRYRTYFNGTDGSWVQGGTEEQSGTGSNRWMFVLKSGARVKDSWVNVRYENSQQLYTYHFDSEGCMDTGWYQDSEGQWYYLVLIPEASRDV